MTDAAKEPMQPDAAAIRRAHAALSCSIALALLGLFVVFALRASPVLLVRLPIVAVVYFAVIALSVRSTRPWRHRHRIDRATVPRSLAILSAIMPITLMPTIFVAFQPTLGLDFFVAVLLIAVGISGGVIAGVAWFHPVPGPPSCDRCGYGLDAFQTTPDVCPECGGGLGTKTAITMSRREPNRGLAAFGLILLTFPLLLGGTLIATGAAAYRFAPTGLLIALADESDSVWPELTTRELTPEQRRTLIKNVIEGPRFTFGRTIGGLDYVVGEHAAGTLEPELADRFFGDAVSLRVTGPESVEAGSPVAVRIEGTTLSLGTNLHPAVHIGPITTADGVVLLDTAETSPRYAHEFRDRATVPVFTLTLPTPGEITIRISVVILAQPGFWPYKVTWDGSKPTIPPEAVWHRELVLTHKITVLPPDAVP